MDELATGVPTADVTVVKIEALSLSMGAVVTNEPLATGAVVANELLATGMVVANADEVATEPVGNAEAEGETMTPVWLGRNARQVVKTATGAELETGGRPIEALATTVVDSARAVTTVVAGSLLGSAKLDVTTLAEPEAVAWGASKVTVKHVV